MQSSKCKSHVLLTSLDSGRQIGTIEIVTLCIQIEQPPFVVSAGKIHGENKNESRESSRNRLISIELYIRLLYIAQCCIYPMLVKSLGKMILNNNWLLCCRAYPPRRNDNKDLKQRLRYVFINSFFFREIKAELRNCVKPQKNVGGCARPLINEGLRRGHYFWPRVSYNWIGLSFFLDRAPTIAVDSTRLE